MYQIKCYVCGRKIAAPTCHRRKCEKCKHPKRRWVRHPKLDTTTYKKLWTRVDRFLHRKYKTPEAKERAYPAVVEAAKLLGKDICSLIGKTSVKRTNRLGYTRCFYCAYWLLKEPVCPRCGKAVTK